MAQHYTPQGNILVARHEDSDLWNGTYPRLAEPVSICNGCGALIADPDRERHDKFHDALAQLWASLVN